MRFDSSFQEVTYEDWLKAAEAQLKGKPIESLFSMTYEGIRIKPLYEKNDVKEPFSLPGSPPYVRGTSENKTDWYISQFITGCEPVSLKKNIQKAIKRGQNSLYFSVENIHSVNDLQMILQDVDVKNIHFHIDATKNRAFLPLLVHYCHIENVPIHELKGTIAFNPFYEMVTLGLNESTFKKAIDYLSSMMNWSGRNGLQLKLVLLDGKVFQQAGANAIQELAFTFLKGIEILEALSEKGHSIEEISKRIQFSFAIGSDFFMEIAKLRAAKHIWATIVNAYDGSLEAQKAYIHAETSTLNKSKLDIHVNLLRTTGEAFAAIIGGVDSLTISPFDALLGNTSELSERIARNTHFIIKEESLLDKVQDPAGGSWYIESLTKQISEKVWSLIQSYEKVGGIIKALQDGKVQKEIEDMYTLKQSDIEKRNKMLIGTNIYANLGEELAVATKEREQKMMKLIQVESVEECLRVLKEEGGNILPLVKTFEQTEENDIRPLMNRRLSKPFETLREKAEKHRQLHGFYPNVSIAVIGQLKDYKARLDFVKGLFATGGIDTNIVPINEAERANSELIIICGADQDYEQLDTSILDRLKEKCDHIWITAPEGHKVLAKWDIEQAVHNKLNFYEFLCHVHDLLGVKA